MGVLDCHASISARSFPSICFSGNVLPYVQKRELGHPLDRLCFVDPMVVTEIVVEEEVYPQACRRILRRREEGEYSDASGKKTVNSPASSSTAVVPLVSGGQGKEVPGTHGM